MSIDSHRLEVLSRVVQGIRMPGEPLHETVCKTTPHMRPQVMSLGLQLALQQWDSAGIARLCEEESPHLSSAIVPRTVGVVLGGVLPPSHIQAMAYPYLLGARLVVRASGSDRVFPTLFAEALGSSIDFVDRSEWDDRLTEFDAVVAVGSDESVRAVRDSIRVDCPVLAFGHRTAIAIVNGAQWNEETVEAGATDVTIFDQLGCLSPREIFLVGSRTQAEDYVGQLAERFERLVPRHSLGFGVESAIRDQVDLARLNGEWVAGPDDLSWGVRLTDGVGWTGTPGGRHVIVRRLETLESLSSALLPVRGYLSAVSLDGYDRSSLREPLIRAGASRIVEGGNLQNAPPRWPHDGRRPLASLCRWCETEMDDDG